MKNNLGSHTELLMGCVSDGWRERWWIQCFSPTPSPKTDRNPFWSWFICHLFMWSFLLICCFEWGQYFLLRHAVVSQNRQNSSRVWIHTFLQRWTLTETSRDIRRSIAFRILNWPSNKKGIVLRLVFLRLSSALPSLQDGQERQVGAAQVGPPSVLEDVADGPRQVASGVV